MIDYALEPDLTAGEFIALLQGTTLGVRRPLAQPDRIDRMLREADLVVTARSEGRLVGVSRALTDFSFCTYLSDLVVDEAFQHRGIGRELVRRTHEAAGPETMLILIAAPGAEAYYPRIGMTQHTSCWFLPRQY